MTTVTTRAVANPGAMRAAAALAYAVTCYLLFLASFLAFAAFVGGLLPPPFALDVSPWQAAAIDIGLVVAFGLQHSIMARQGFKRVWTRIVPPVAERATYVLAASIMLGALVALWQPLSGAVWSVENATGGRRRFEAAPARVLAVIRGIVSGRLSGEVRHAAAGVRPGCRNSGRASPGSVGHRRRC